MNKEIIKELEQKFQKISNKGYIKGIYNSFSSIGRTFESELNLPRNKESVPDYKGIEIKTRRTYSKSAITLFTAVPDNDGNYEIERLKDTYGYPYKNDKKFKVLYCDVYGNKLNFGGIKYQYMLEVNKNDKKVYLCIYDYKGNLIEKKIYWSFEYLKNKLLTKLTYLALVNTYTTKKDGWNFFKYYKIEFYKLISFEKFIELLKSGTIKITFKIGIYLDEKNYGKIYDHGCGFAIKAENINKLFSKIK